MPATKIDERVLVMAPVSQDAVAMAELLQARGCLAQICRNPPECAQLISEGAGALLLTEEALELPDASVLLEILKQQPPWSELPLIILTSGGESRAVRLLNLTATAAGGVTLLERPMSTATLWRSVEVALRSRRRQYQARDLIDVRARLAAIVEFSDDAIISKDLKGIITSWNRGAERLFGYTAREAVGQSITILIPEDRRDEEPKILARMRQGEAMEHFETVRRRKDGTRLDISLTISPVRDEQGKIVGVSKIARDITARKQAALELHKFVSLADQSSEFIGMCGLDFVPFYINPSGLQMVGLEDMAAARRVHVQDFFFPEDEKLLAAEFFPTVLKTGRGEREVRFRHFKTGEPIWMLYTVTSVKDANDRIAGFATVSRNITERKRADKERETLLARERAARQEAEEARAHFRSLFESAPGLYLVLRGDDFNIVGVSQAYLEATMTERAKIIGKNLFEVFPDEPNNPAADGVRNLRASLERVKKTRDRDVMAVQRYPIQRPKEQGGGFEECFWSPINSPVLHPDGQLAFIIHRVEDVTQYVRLKQARNEWTEGHKLDGREEQMEAEIVARSHELQLANERLRETQARLAEANEQLYSRAKQLDMLVEKRTADLRVTNEQLEAFVYSIAHDLRAPLRSMMGFPQLLLTEHSAGLDDTARQLLARIERASGFMDKLLVDLLAYSRTASGEIELASVPLARVWKSALFQCATQIEETDAQIDTVIPLPAVSAHEATLGQCFANLLSNALKFIPPETTPRIRFWTEEHRGFIRIWVEDNGIGIPEDQHERVFQVFERIHGSRYPGTGIGLSIVRKGVERMGGKVGLTSTPDVGTRVWLELRPAS